jgi:hypothetical protein
VSAGKEGIEEMNLRRPLLLALAGASAVGAAVLPAAALKAHAAVASPPIVSFDLDYRDLSGGCTGTYTVSYTGVNVAPNAQILLDYGDGSVDVKIANGYSYTFAPHYFRSTSGNAWVQTAYVYPGANAISGEGVGVALTTKLLGPTCP